MGNNFGIIRVACATPKIKPGNPEYNCNEIIKLSGEASILPDRHFPPPSSPRRTGCEPAETHGTLGTGSDGDLSKSVAKALRAGIDREEKRGITTILFTPPGAIGAFAKIGRAHV